MKQFFTCLFFFSLCFSTLHSQTAEVSGRVTDAEAEPLPFANVLLYSAADSGLVKAAYSGDDGSFSLGPVTAGKFWVQISFTGLTPYTSEPFTLKEGEERKMEVVSLQEAETEIEEVKIRAVKPLVTVKPDMTVFNVSESPNAIGSNAFDLLRKAPGIVVDNNDNVTLLGKTGVRIYIDGKPSYLSTADLAAMLKSMQSNQIESIEIITNPSSKYDAEGNAGIINIKMKRDERFGVNASVNLGYAVGVLSKFNGGASLNYRSKYLSAFGSYSAGAGARRNFMDLYRIQNGTLYDQSSFTINEYQDHNFRAGMDVYLGEKHTLGVMANGFYSANDRQNYSSTNISPVESTRIDSILYSTTRNNGNRLNLNGNLNYRYDNKKGETWNVDLDYGYFDIDVDVWQPNYYLDSSRSNILSQRIFANLTPARIDILTGKLDHERKLLGGTFAAGLKISWVTTDNTFDFFDVYPDSTVLNFDRSNNFVYRENVNAAYFNYKRQIKKWGIQLGLRTEHTNSLGVLSSAKETENDRVERNYVSFFPSGGVTFSPSRENVFRLSYSRRIDRPRYQDLNPFEFKLDELTYQRGNPFLQPQFSHNIELNHTFKYTLNTTLSYSLTDDFFTEIVDTTETTRSFLTTRNLATRHVANLNVSYPFSITKWWSTYTNAGVRYLRNQADFGEGKSIDVARFTYNFYHQSTFNLPWEVSIQLSGFYNSPGIWGANSLTSKFWGIDAGVLKKFMKGRGTLKLSVTDIFFTMQWRGVQQFGGLYMDARGGWESRQFKVDFSWNFGNEKVKSRKRKTGLEDEKGRVKGD